MAKRITPEQIQEMIKLYNELNTYSAVAAKMGISASTVSRYIKENQSQQQIQFSNNIAAKPVEEISFNSIITFATLTEAEKESMINWLKEFLRA